MHTSPSELSSVMGESHDGEVRLSSYILMYSILDRVPILLKLYDHIVPTIEKIKYTFGS